MDLQTPFFGVMASKPLIDFQEIGRRLRDLSLPAADAVVGIRTGGVVPASLVAFHTGLPLYFIGLNYRRPGDHVPVHAEPTLTAQVPVIPDSRTHLILVDDVGVSGASLRAAAAHFPGRSLTTLVFKGRAELVLFPEIDGCVQWPWNP
jgi:xanthine phosphoribosyltransferase